MADEMQGIMSLPEQPAAPAPTPEQTAAVDQMRSQVSPREINTEMLGAAEEADPATVAEFKAELQGLQLPPEVLDMLNTMVEEILDAPQDYPALRAKYMAQGLEDLLPPEFDATFFGALNIAIDQIRDASPTAQGPMPAGVTTPEDIFTFNPAAAAPMPPQGFANGGIASLGRNGDTMLAHINPQEAAMLRSRGGSGSINPATGLPEFFSLSGAFKKIGKAVKKFASSTVGKIVIGAALFAVTGGAATGLLGGFGSAAVAAGQGFVAGAGTSLLGGGNLKQSLKAGAVGALAAGAFKGITQGKEAFKAVPQTKAPIFESVATNAGATPPPADITGTLPTTQLPVSQLPAAQGIGSLAGTPTTQGAAGRFADAVVKPPLLNAGDALSVASTPPPPTGFFGNIKDAFTNDRLGAGGSDSVGFFKGLNRAFNPNEIAAAAKAAGNPDPSAFAKYGPLVAGGLGIMAATGGFEEEEPVVPAGFEDMAKGISPGQKLLKEYPDLYGLQFGGVNTTYGYNPAEYANQYMRPIKKREGGTAEYPRKIGQINGPGTGTSDDVPAMLSDGEFVFTAKAVRSMGNGSRRTGAKRMLALMKKLEGRTNG